MVNSPTGPSRARKDEKFDFISYIEDLKNRADIIRVAEQQGLTLNKHGQAECFNNHDQKTPSLKFYENTQSYHCFGCGSHGDVIGLLQHLKGCSFIDAVNELAGSVGMDRFPNTNGFDPEMYAKIKDCLNSAAEIYHSQLESTDPYLAGRGISCDTARCHLIGRTRGRDDLWKALSTKGIPADVAFLSGLVKSDFTDFFQDHIVVPIINRGTVVDFYGRLLNEDCNQRHWRLPNERVKIGHGLFNWNPRAEELILVEGVFDALALIEHGFENAVATFGTSGLKDHHLRMIGKSSARKIFIAYDGDASGREAALKTGYAVEGIVKEVRLIEIPDGNDPADFLLTYSREDFEAFLGSALAPFDSQVCEVNLLESRDEQLRTVRDDLLPRVKQADPILQPELIRKIHEELGIGIRALQEQLKLTDVHAGQSKNEAASEVLNLQKINPALDLVNGKMILSVPRKVRTAGDPIPRWQNTIISSDRERFVLTPEELAARGWHAPSLERVDVRVAEERYSSEAIQGFLDGNPIGDTDRTFTRIRDVIKLYLDFTDERTYDYLACWIIGTYFFPIFSHYPYLHFTGPKGSGKSQCLHVLRSLCHNAKIAGSMTLAVQFRLIGALQPTLLFDEMENLGQTQHTELHRMLKYGFERNGPEVWRMESSQNRMEMSSWSVYCPRAFASIEGMEDVIGSRSVQIIMERSFNDEIKGRTVNAEDAVWQEIRDLLFVVTLTEGSHIKAIYDSLEKPQQIHYSGRDWDIFKGVLAVAQAVGREEVKEQVIGFAMDSHRLRLERDHDNSPDMIILNYLSETVTTSGWYELEQLHSGLIQIATAQGLDLQGPMTKERFGKRLSSLRVYDKRNRSTRSGEKIMEYWMEPTCITKKLENHLRG